MVTYHPVTLADEPAQESFGALLEALDQFPEYQVVITYPNADDGGRSIIPLLEEYALRQPERVKAVPSLGQKRYLSAVRLSTAVIGNSSSGISEVPSLKIPTVNIGQRQKGRLCANSVIHCKPEADAIADAIKKALLSREELDYQNPYGKGMVGVKILEVIKAIDVKSTKVFYDL